MNAVADRFADRGVASVFLYTYEAHPGEHFPHLTSMEHFLVRDHIAFGWVMFVVALVPIFLMGI